MKRKICLLLLPLLNVGGLGAWMTVVGKKRMVAHWVGGREWHWQRTIVDSDVSSVLLENCPGMLWSKSTERRHWLGMDPNNRKKNGDLLARQMGGMVFKGS